MDEMTKLNRRRFLTATGGALLGAGALAVPRRARAAVSANEKIVIAHIGVGGQGNAHVSWFAGLPDVECAAICDVDEGHRLQTLDRLKKMRPDTKAVPVADFREILDRPDIDAVTCGTPDHWHALITVLAMQAGKDVYSEKPLSTSFSEAQAMRRAAHRYGRVFQLGTQIHAGDNYHRVVELVRSGVLGEIHTVRAWKNGGSPGCGWGGETNPPPGLDWNLWLGPAPWHPYVPARCHFTFRYFWDYSGGNYADFWCHIVDLVQWALEPKGLRSASARGEAVTDGIADTPRWIDVDYEFDGLKLFWTTEPPDLPGCKQRGIGARFEGTKGALVADYGSRVIYLDGKEMDDIPEVPKSIPRSPGHQRNFVDCVKSRGVTESNIEHAYRLTTGMYLGEISFRLGRPVTWDPDKEEIVGDDAANRMLTRPYRAPWYLPV